MENIPHRWDLTPTEAVILQKELAAQVDAGSPITISALTLVAGVDVSVKNNVSRAAIVVMTFPALEPVEAVTAQMPTPFPSISGLLSFREGAVILAARQKLKSAPDAFLFDGMGIMHPRRIGIASHIGLWFDAPTVGVGKTKLLGEFDEPGAQKGDFSPLLHKGDYLGDVLRTRAKVKPVFVSVGHKATTASARELVLQCVTRYRLPAPIRAAHNTAGEF
jgi:deoxyribonuclease V